VKLRGDAAQLAHADFTYNVDAWKPEVSYHTLGGTSDLSIEQPRGGHTHIGDTTYVWDLQMANDVPLELLAHLGAGNARLDLSSLTMRRVEVEMGVGELNMDLRGTPKHDFDVRIQGGIGEATIHLPRDVGIYATGSGGIGEIHTEGLRKQGDHWVNDAYDNAKVRIHVNVEGGIGQINLLVG
jgi:predicted membrane protein